MSQYYVSVVFDLGADAAVDVCAQAVRSAAARVPEADAVPAVLGAAGATASAAAGPSGGAGGGSSPATPAPAHVPAGHDASRQRPTASPARQTP